MIIKKRIEFVKFLIYYLMKNAFDTNMIKTVQKNPVKYMQV